MTTPLQQLGERGQSVPERRRPAADHPEREALEAPDHPLTGLRPGGLGRIDAARHGAQVGENFVELTRTEYQLLELLMLNPRQVLSHSLIYDRVWGYDFGPASNALRVYVGYLRRKLEDAGARQLIHTVRGVGYVLREP